MNLSQIKEQGISAEILEENIKLHAEQYYIDGSSEISDEEFDELVDALKSINPNSEFLKTGWGYSPSVMEGEKVNHRYQNIGSLEKAKTYDEVDKSLKNKEVIISAKLDGLTAVAYYKNGNLETAATRGDGIVGINITDKFNFITGNIKMSESFNGAVRGELVITNDNWTELKVASPNLKSQRNSAVGIIGRDGVSPDLKYLSFVAYNIMGTDYHGFVEQEDILQYLFENYGLENTVPSTQMKLESADQFEDMYNNFAKKYPVDGIVITENKISYNGDTVQYNQCAFKFSGIKKNAVVTGVTWNMSKQNKLIPIVNIEPTELSGATISNVTGINAQYILDNKIGKGAIVEVTRSGMVIPKITCIIKPYIKD